MRSYNVEYEISRLPEGLGKEILTILSNHKGREKAILGDRLTEIVQFRGFVVNNRQVRLQISQLRKSGVLIGSAPGSAGGYYICSSPEELEEFVREEYLPKINDMRETLSAMRKAASKHWGKAAKHDNALQQSFL